MDGLEFLNLYKCDTRVYRRIVEIKKQNGSWIGSVKLETSIKIISGVTDPRMGRWTVTMLIDEFRQFTEQEQREIVELTGFDYNEMAPMIAKVSAGADIIFGGDGGTGKLYIDTGRGLVCYETTGKKKYYIQETQDKLRVYCDGQLVSYHIRVNGEDGIYWMGIGKDFKTYYIRPGSASVGSEMVSYLKYLVQSIF
jgi:hypothetical protein